MLEPQTNRRRAALRGLLGLIGVALLAGVLAACGRPADHARLGRPDPVGAGIPASPTVPHRGPQRRPPTPPLALSSLLGRIAFSHGDDVWAAAADGSQARRLTSRPGPEFDPSWSPDGSRIVYRDSRRGINANDEIYIMNSDGSASRNITHSLENEWSPTWSPDGKLIAFFAGELFVIRPDGTGRRPITKIEGEYPAWSPDGRRLAFMSAEPNARGSDPNYDIFVVNRDGTGLRQLSDWRGEDGWPTWSPDGKSIAFTTTHKVFRGGRAVWAMCADGSGKHLIAFGEFPVWSPYGGVIMFSTSGGANGDHLRVARPDGTGLRKLPISGWLPDLH